MINKKDRKQIIALEGPVASGKSTIINLCMSKGYPVIQEYSEYEKLYPMKNRIFPPENKKSAEENFNYFLDLEKKRVDDYKRIKDKELVFLDRSVFTLAAFEKGMSYIGKFNIFNQCVEEIIKHKEKVLWPDKIFYFNLNILECRRRIESESMSTHQIFTNTDFDKGFKEAFEYLENQNIVKVITIDASQNSGALFKEIIKIVN